MATASPSFGFFASSEELGPDEIIRAAQATATTAVLAPGRFTFGAGAGEALNEHILGDGGVARSTSRPGTW
jgi:hypothetical protein